MERFRTLVVFGVLIVAGCGGANTTSGPVVPDQNSAAPAEHSRKAVRSALKQAHSIPPYLYVTEPFNDAVYVLQNKTYRDVGAILVNDRPYGVWLDRKGNLYEAEQDNVSEYAPGNLDGSAPNFVYQPFDQAQPVAVTTDAHDNVFVTSANSGTVSEYFQGDTRKPSLACGIQNASSIFGVAVDSSGDVFVAVTVGYTNVNADYIAEYPGGLRGCNLQDTGILLTDQEILGGMVFDNNDNLLVANGTRVLVIDPPYSSITTTIGSGFANATDVTLNKKNSMAYVTDMRNGTVTLVGYPGGTNLTVLGGRNGLYAPYGAVDWPNAGY